MKRTLALSSLLVVLCAGGAVFAQPASDAGSSSEQAGAMFERGIKVFHEGDYEAAMIHFRKAYQLDPNWRVLYNVGQTSKELRDYAGAFESFQRYLAEGGVEIGKERREEVGRLLDELKSRVATVTITSNVEDADVSIDDIFIGKTPLLKPLTVNAGRRKLVVQKSGYAPLTRYEDLAGTERRQLELQLVPLTLAPNATPPKPSPDQGPATDVPPSDASSREPSAVPWILLGVTAGVGLATAVFGGLTLSKNADLDSALDTYPTSQTAIDDARSDAQTFAAIADTLGVLTLIGLGSTVAAFVIDGSSDTDSNATSNDVALRLSIGPGFVGLNGSY